MPFRQRSLSARRSISLISNRHLKSHGPFTLTGFYPAKTENQGVYPVVVIIHYSDANGYPFSALLCRTFSLHQNEPVAEIFGEMTPATLSKKGKIKLTLKNTGKSEIKTSTTLIAPKEFKISQEKQQTAVLSKAVKKLSFPVENFSALTGSQYQIYAISEYEQNGIHQTSITPRKNHGHRI